MLACSQSNAMLCHYVEMGEGPAMGWPSLARSLTGLERRLRVADHVCACQGIAGAGWILQSPASEKQSQLKTASKVCHMSS